MMLNPLLLKNRENKSSPKDKPHSWFLDIKAINNCLCLHQWEGLKEVCVIKEEIVML